MSGQPPKLFGKTKHMVTLNCNSTFGNFAWKATASVSEEQAKVLADMGLLQILQRSPASQAEKSLAGYEKRPDKFERKSIAYSDANARSLEKFLSGKLEIAEGVFIDATVTAEFHEIGATSLPKFVEEKAIAKRHIDAGDFAQWMANTVGFKATVEDADKTETLVAIKAFKTKMLASV
jgi:hypothetical protein